MVLCFFSPSLSLSFFFSFPFFFFFLRSRKSGCFEWYRWIAQNNIISICFSSAKSIVTFDACIVTGRDIQALCWLSRPTLSIEERLPSRALRYCVLLTSKSVKPVHASCSIFVPEADRVARRNSEAVAHLFGKSNFFGRHCKAA